MELLVIVAFENAPIAVELRPVAHAVCRPLRYIKGDWMVITAAAMAAARRCRIPISRPTP